MTMNNKFNYKYVALSEEERKEVDNIKSQYVYKEKTETKLERLRRLNNKVKSLPEILSLCVGILGCLIFGLGLAMVLEWDILVWGIVIMAIGSIPMLIAYPLFKMVLKKQKETYGDEIIKLSNELLGGDEE